MSTQHKSAYTNHYSHSYCYEESNRIYKFVIDESEPLKILNSGATNDRSLTNALTALYYSSSSHIISIVKQ